MFAIRAQPTPPPRRPISATRGRRPRAIERELSAAGFCSTLVLVTGGATLAGLVSRVKRANEWPADLFLSIHHDSVPARFLDVWDHEGVQRKYSDRFRGHFMFVSHENPQAAASLYFAQLLGDELKARALKYTPHYAEAFMQEGAASFSTPLPGYIATTNSLCSKVRVCRQSCLRPARS